MASRLKPVTPEGELTRAAVSPVVMVRPIDPMRAKDPSTLPPTSFYNGAAKYLKGFHFMNRNSQASLLACMSCPSPICNARCRASRCVVVHTLAEIDVVMTTGLTSGQVIASYTVPANEAVGVETCDTPNHCTGKVAYRQAVLNAPQGETFPAGLGNRLAQKRALMRWPDCSEGGANPRLGSGALDSRTPSSLCCFAALSVTVHLR